MQAPLHPDEPHRLAALHGYRILDTPEEREFDETARLASALCEAPMAAISFVAEHRQWFKAEVGLGVRQTPRDVSICAHAILGDGDVFEVRDLTTDPRFADNPYVVGPPGLRFYASAPLRSLEGRPIGALCVMDVRPRTLSHVQRLALRTMANQVMAQLELRRLLGLQRDSEAAALARERTQRFLLDLEDALRQLGDPGQVMREAASRLAAHLGADRCVYAVVEPDDGGYTVTADGAVPDPALPPRLSAADFGPALHAAMHDGRPYVADDVDADPTLPSPTRSVLRAACIASAVCVPLRRAGRFAAALAVTQRAPRRWLAEEVALAGNVADRCRETLERVQAEARAARERRHAEIALGAGRMGLWEFDPRSGEHRWGDGMYAIFGVRPGDGRLDGRRFESLLAGDDDRARVRAGIAQLVERGGEMEVEYRIRRADTGELRWVLTRGALLREDGPPLLVGVSVDHTSRKLAEHRLLEADARKDEFLAMLAHELRNPLAPLTNALHVLRRGRTDDASARDMLAMAERQLRQLTRLVDDLLEVGRITRGKIVLRIEPLRIADAVKAAVESANPVVERRGQRLEVSLPSEPLAIDADPTRVAQVLENLLINASKYTPEGGCIRVEARTAGDAAEIRVIDDGIGIEADQIPFLFDLFSQIDATIDRAQGGLGIGLAMVRRLVELHGGTVSADSPGLGRGATFTVRLPRGRVLPRAETEGALRA
jgi:signal transduction histidine kinase